MSEVMKYAVNNPNNSSIPTSRQRKNGHLNHSSYKWWKDRMKKNVTQNDWNDWQLNENTELMETGKKTQGHVKS